MQCIIYGLAVARDPATFHYIGQTQCQPKYRFKWLMRYLQREGKKASQPQLASWMSSVKLTGDKILMRVLDENGTWNVSEILWIDKMRRDGHPLKNILLGGDDSYGDYLRRNGMLKTAKQKRDQRQWRRKTRIWRDSWNPGA